MKGIYKIDPKSYFYDLHPNFYQNELLKGIKTAFDPKHILNPGKLYKVN